MCVNSTCTYGLKEAACVLRDFHRAFEQKLIKIGLVIPNMLNHLESELVCSIEEAAREHDSFLVLRQSLGDSEQEKAAVQKLLAFGVDGLIVLPTQGEYFNAEILKLAGRKFPIVLIERYLKGIHTPFITTNNVAAAKKATDYLFKLGHNHIALLSSPPLNTTSIEDRIEGFIQAHLDRGIIVEKKVCLNDITAGFSIPLEKAQIDRDIDKLIKHLKRYPSITALFVTEYPIALLAEIAAEKLGLRVPQDISILCFDSPPVDLSGRTQFTHIHQNADKMGSLAVEYVLQMIHYQSLPENTLLEAAFKIGESTGTARS